ncbi:acetylxylan esterase [Actinorugispora endophytica]|uniref:Cephalosporin-C deacetylase n=1 Tax=Actinorugispora endophytica TaxID=1605990 RepID=A0A4R6ULV3_9ACTN|nr:acetylxylan esterase [Actinorugispora endophytica]TDQ46373.1 cephalosporin-C deacetylase [Actinorugispora endophytica]
MPHFDLPLDQLRGYRSQVAEPDGFQEFWDATLAQARGFDLDAVFTPVDSGLRTVATSDVVFRGFAGAPVRAWLHLPAHREGPLPGVVEYAGYGGGRGLAHENTVWAAAGYAHLVMDTRGQGSGWRGGVTADAAPEAGDPAAPGFMTRGIADPDSYYYRRVFTDAVRAVEALRAHDGVDPDRVAVAGGSQGGGIALAVSGLVDDLSAVMADVPFLCDFPRALSVADSDPYQEVVRYLKVHRDRVDQVMRTLAHFDGSVMARRAAAPALFSVGLMDGVCPPSTVFAAYNAYAGAKDIAVYPYNGHEGGAEHHQVEKFRWLAATL